MSLHSNTSNPYFERNNFIVIGLTRPGLEPKIYHTRGEHANHSAILLKGPNCKYVCLIQQQFSLEIRTRFIFIDYFGSCQNQYVFVFQEKLSNNIKKNNKKQRKKTLWEHLQKLIGKESMEVIFIEIKSFF